MFANLTNMEFFFMGGAGAQDLFASTFSSFPRLKRLLLYENKISDIPDGAFDQNTQLYELQLNENRIQAVQESTFKTLQNSLRKLDLSGNPFVCDCDLRWFSAWMRNNHSLFSKSWTTYNCINLAGSSVKEFRMTPQACMLHQDTAETIIYATSFFTLLVVGLSLGFHYHWFLWLRLYESFRGPSDLRRRVIRTGHFDFDVFVCYSSMDKNWVVKHLMPQLEGRLGLKLCIHERDFIPGKQIIDNIVECIEHSKRIVLVFSKDFLLSHWCQFELAVCLQHALDCHDSLLAVCLGDVIQRDDLTAAMKVVMGTMTYIQWEGSSALFWQRMDKAMEDVTNTSKHRPCFHHH
jgi:hypothetical protein